MILEKLEDKQLIENDNENETVRGQILPLPRTVPNSKTSWVSDRAIKGKRRSQR